MAPFETFFGRGDRRSQKERAQVADEMFTVMKKDLGGEQGPEPDPALGKLIGYIEGSNDSIESLKNDVHAVGDRIRVDFGMRGHENLEADDALHTRFLLRTAAVGHMLMQAAQRAKNKKELIVHLQAVRNDIQRLTKHGTGV